MQELLWIRIQVLHPRQEGYRVKIVGDWVLCTGKADLVIDKELCELSATY